MHEAWSALRVAWIADHAGSDELRAAQRIAIAGLPALARRQARTLPAVLGLPDHGTGAAVAARFAAGLEQAA